MLLEIESSVPNHHKKQMKATSKDIKKWNIKKRHERHQKTKASKMEKTMIHKLVNWKLRKRIKKAVREATIAGSVRGVA